MPQFVRYQSAVPNRHGRFPGVFALANGLRDDGLLTAEDQSWLLEANQKATEAYVDPSTVYAACYDSTVNPGARAWFVADATDLLAMTVPYLQLLDRYEVPWMQLTTRTPGRIVYQDAAQVVAVPYQHPEDWPFP
ncbi:hypothetical protein [Curtobacterium sp. MCBD17_040]|uniref:hypothetical protein n=1 Tax=Curtobacterium sp. MCBD17_040 TaxID=2175674 RepID=UPI000DA9FEDC|nr:hypothetical protein [Curtobacterium sp. MCBD17_040]WIB65776.1 hypothetical protein DEI94_16810 [Curtobacterium sp. MCBD17_040]